MRNRPIMTGGYLHPTLYNPPLPDLKPQPSHISGMIVTRKRVRARRIDDMAWYVSIREDLMQEAAFEDELAKLHPDNFSNSRIFSWDLRSEWGTRHLDYICRNGCLITYRRIDSTPTRRSAVRVHRARP